MNYENFNRVLTHIERNPEEWRQYSCGSCFLVHAGRIAGHPNPSRFPWASPKLRRWLGLDVHQMAWMYCCDRTLNQFRSMRLVAGYANFAKAA